jgi:invasion protein IalB
MFTVMILSSRRFLLALSVCSVLAASAEAAKQNPAPSGGNQIAASGVTSLGGSDDWNAYLDNAAGGKICYIIGKPKKSDPAKHGMSALSVTHRPADKVENVVNFAMGTPLRPGTAAEVDIDGKNFSLFTEKEGAWARDTATDKAAVAAMLKGRDATIKALPSHGAPITDIYALKGFAAAMKLIDTACGVRR